MMRYIMTTLLVILSAASVLAQSDDMTEPRLSYLVCEWGLLTIEEPTTQPSVFVEIDAPADYSAVEGTMFTVAGTGAGLVDETVIVEASLQGGDVLFEGTAELTEGAWSVDVDLGELDGATAIFIRAFSTPDDNDRSGFDSLRLNANSQFGLRFIEITRPYFGASVNTSPMVIEGMAGSAFENNIVIEVREFETGEVLVETFGTVQTDELGGSGPFSTEVRLDVEPGTEIEVYAYQPAIADSDSVEISDIEFAIVSPLAQTYDRFLTIKRSDPIAGAQDVCATAEAEFDNEMIQPLVINNVIVLATRSMLPLVNLNIEAAGSSVCAAPQRTRITRDGDTFAIEVYIDTTEPVICTADLAPIPVRVSLGTLESPDYAITVNGEPVE